MVLFNNCLLSACSVLNIRQEGTSVSKTDKAPTLLEFTFLRVGRETEGKQVKINEKILDNDTYHKENKEYCVRKCLCVLRVCDKMVRKTLSEDMTFDLRPEL